MSAHLRRVIAVRALIGLTLLAIGVVLAARTARHPLLHARCLGARVVRRVPGRPGDGEALSEDEVRAWIAICRGWKRDAERSPA